MALGYGETVHFLAFDHRDSFQKKLFGVPGDPSPEASRAIVEAKRVIFDGTLRAVRCGGQAGATGVLVDEQFGNEIPQLAREQGLKLAVPVERSGQDEFDFEYGPEFGAHIERANPDFSKVLVRLNPDDDPTMNGRQLARLKELSDWLRSKERKFLFELLVPPTRDQLATVGGDVDRYDRELRPELMCRAIEAIQRSGIEVDIWKLEGVERRSDAEMLVAQARQGAGRDMVGCVLLGRGASTPKVIHWLRVVSSVDGFIGFAIGRSIWWDALKRYLAGHSSRDEAVSQIATNYLKLVQVYDQAVAGQNGS